MQPPFQGTGRIAFVPTLGRAYVKEDRSRTMSPRSLYWRASRSRDAPMKESQGATMETGVSVAPKRSSVLPGLLMLLLFEVIGWWALRLNLDQQLGIGARFWL